MKATPFLFAVSSVALLTVACERKPQVVVVEERRVEVAPPQSATTTFETERLGREIDAYERTPSAKQAADVQKAFAELDGEIAELNERAAKSTGDERAEAAQKAANLTAYRASEDARFLKAKAMSTNPRSADVSISSEKVEDSARKAGNAVEDAAKTVGEGLKDVADSVRDAVR